MVIVNCCLSAIAIAAVLIRNKNASQDALQNLVQDIGKEAQEDGNRTREKFSDIIKETVKEIGDQSSKTQVALSNQGGDLLAKLLDQGSALRAGVIEEISKKSDEALNVNRNAFTEIRKLMDEKLLAIGQKTEETIQNNFKEATDNFQKVLTGLAKMDEVRREMQHLSSNVTSLDKVLSNSKSIGTFGEVQLQQILQNAFGNSDRCYKMQYELRAKDQSGRSMRPDAVLFMPEPTGMICIDSKFPLDSYRAYVNGSAGSGIFQNNVSSTGATMAMQDRQHSAATTETPETVLPQGEANSETPHANHLGNASSNRHADNLIKSIKAKIDEVAKYIVSGETADFAIMFIPSEAIFAEITARHWAIQDYAQKKKVYIVSPTTLMAVSSVAQATLMKIQMSKNAEQIRYHLGKLSEDFGRYTERWKKLENQIRTVSSTATEINTTNSKIINSFRNIQQQNVIESTGDQLSIGILEHAQGGNLGRTSDSRVEQTEAMAFCNNQEQEENGF